MEGHQAAVIQADYHVMTNWDATRNTHKCEYYPFQQINTHTQEKEEEEKRWQHEATQNTHECEYDPFQQTNTQTQKKEKKDDNTTNKQTQKNNNKNKW